MMTKTTVVSLFALSLLALSGIGYAAFTSTVNASITATAGNVNLIWYNAVADGSNPYYASCVPSSYSSNTEVFTVSAIAPGDGGCLFDVQIQNTGNVPVNSITPSAASGTTFGPYACFTVTYSSVPGSLGPGMASGWFYLRIYIDSSMGQGCASQTGTYTLSFTGST